MGGLRWERLGLLSVSGVVSISSKAQATVETPSVRIPDICFSLQASFAAVSRPEGSSTCSTSEGSEAEASMGSSLMVMDAVLGSLVEVGGVKALMSSVLGLTTLFSEEGSVFADLVIPVVISCGCSGSLDTWDGRGCFSGSCMVSLGDSGPFVEGTSVSAAGCISMEMNRDK